MAIDKIQAEGINLADTFAFTGTVTGTPSGMTLLASQTATGSGASSLAFDEAISATYPYYRIYIDSLTPTGNSTNFYCRFIQAAGVITSSDYVHVTNAATRNISTDASGNTYNAGEGTFGRLNGASALSNNDQYATNMIIDILNPLNTTSYKSIQWQSTTISDSTVNYFTNNGSVWLKNTSALTGIQFYFSSGDVAVPTKMRMYGVTGT
jgi:hypothetical protein